MKTKVIFKIISLSLLCIITFTGCNSASGGTVESLLILTPLPTQILSPIPTATYFANPTELTASSAAQTPTIEYYTNLPLDGSQCIPENPPIKVRVNRVIDGDTIEIDVDGNLVLLRYIGIEAPKLDDEGKLAFYSAEATNKNAELVGGKEVFLIRDQEPTNGYGYFLGYILTDETFVNYQLVKDGYAKAVPFKPNISCKSVFAVAEAQARSEHLGMWSQ